MAYSIFESYMNKLNESTESEWQEVRSKYVTDSDGFQTDYTWYTNGDTHIFMFGDKELYGPNPDYADWEAETEAEAQEWFDSYHGFDDDEDDYVDEGFNKEEFFDKGFEEAYGIESEQPLVESFGDFPDWLVSFLNKNASVKRELVKKGIDLHNAKFIEGQLPRNAFDPVFKDTGRLSVFRLDSEYSGDRVYIVGFNSPEIRIKNSYGGWEYREVTKVAKKTLLDHALDYGYIDYSDPSSSSLALRKERSDARYGMDDRDPKKGQHAIKTNIEYGTKSNGRTDYDTIVSYDIKWITDRGYDKSGYKLDPDKYGRMLDDAGLDNYSVRLEMLNKKLEGVRSRIIALFQQYTARDSANYRSKDSWDNGIYSDLSRVTQDFSRAITAYVSLEQNIDSILKRDAEEGDDENWNVDKRIAYTFKWDGKRVRDYITACTDLLKKIESPEKLQ